MRTGKKIKTPRLAKLVVVGAGLVGKRHVAAIKQSSNSEITGIVDPSPAGKTFAKEHEIKWFSNLSQMINKLKPRNLDGIILATPNNMHLEQGLFCIENAIPVLIEKPITVTVADALKIVQASEEHQIPVLVGHHRRHNPLMKKSKELIIQGKIGQIRAVHSQTWYYKPDYYFNEVNWRKEKGAGPIFVNLIHDIDCIRYLCGEIIEVNAKSTQAIRGYANEDTTVAILTFANGALGTITISDSISAPWNWEMTARENPAYPSTDNSCYFIGGSKGSLSIPNLTYWNYSGNYRKEKLTSEVNKINESDWWQPISATYLAHGNSDPLINQIEHFGRVILDGETPLVSAKEGLKTLIITEKIQKSVNF